MSGGYVVHETSIIGSKADIGRNTRIWQFCNIMDNVTVGDDCNIGQGVFIESGVRIGNHVKVKNNVALYKGIICEDDVFLGPNCVFTNVMLPRSFLEKKDEFKETIIKKGATVGANATILCGNTIGTYAFVGAGSVVTRDVPDYALVMGNPAKIKGYVCQCGAKLSTMEGTKYQCGICLKQYIRLNDKFVEKWND